MKIFKLTVFLAIISLAGNAKGHKFFFFNDSVKNKHQLDSVKLITEGTHAYYQRTVKVDSNITEGKIYIRALQFMASKNIVQTYGYEQEGKLIFTTTQDLNQATNESEDPVDPYAVQFAIILDLKNGRYRYTITNVLFFLPTESGNKREALDEVYAKSTNTDSRRAMKDAKKLITSFERYLNTLTNELYEGIEQKAAIYKAGF